VESQKIAVMKNKSRHPGICEEIIHVVPFSKVQNSLGGQVGV
jgi:hypothetical protein